MGYIKRGVHLEVLFSSSGLKFSLTNFYQFCLYFRECEPLLPGLSAVSCQTDA